MIIFLKMCSHTDIVKCTCTAVSDPHKMNQHVCVFKSVDAGFEGSLSWHHLAVQCVKRSYICSEQTYVLGNAMPAVVTV